MNASIIQNEKGMVLMIALMILVIMSMMGLAAILTGTTDVQIAANSAHSTQALYLAESGVHQVQNWFYNPASFNPPGGSYTLDANNSMGTYSFPGQFFSPRRTSDGFPSFYNSSNMSQFTDINNSNSITAIDANNANDDINTVTDRNSLRAGDYPVLSIKAPPEPGGTAAADTYLNNTSTGLFKDLAKMGRVTILEVYPPLYATNYATVRVKAVDTAGAARTVEAEIGPVLTSLFPVGLTGRNKITLNGNSCTDSYDSEVGAYGGSGMSCTGAGSNGNIATDATGSGSIYMDSNAVVNGNATIGPGGDVNTGITTSGNSVINGTESVASEVGTYPTVTAPTGLPCGSSINITSGTTTIGSAGTSTTVCYSSITVDSNAVLRLLGDVTLVVTNNFRVDSNAYVDGAGGTLSAYVGGQLNLRGNGLVTGANKPENMSFIVTGNQAVTLDSNANMYATIYAPNSDVTIDSNAGFYGAVVGKQVTVDSNGGVHFDEALSRKEGVIVGYSTGAWREVRTP